MSSEDQLVRLQLVRSKSAQDWGVAVQPTLLQLVRLQLVRAQLAWSSGGACDQLVRDQLVRV